MGQVLGCVRPQTANDASFSTVLSSITKPQKQAEDRPTGATAVSSQLRSSRASASSSLYLKPNIDECAESAVGTEVKGPACTEEVAPRSPQEERREGHETQVRMHLVVPVQRRGCLLSPLTCLGVFDATSPLPRPRALP